MWEFFSIRRLRAGKVHTCAECRGCIAKGDEHDYCAGKVEGEFDAYRLCLPCSRLTSAYCREISEDGFPLGETRAVLLAEYGVEDVDAWVVASEAREAERIVKEKARKVEVEARLAALDGVICPVCHATLATYGEACTAALDDACPGFLAIERATRS